MNYGTLVCNVAGQMVGGSAVVFFIGFILDYIRSMWFSK